MTPATPQPGDPVWTAVALSRAVQTKPAKVWLDGAPLVLFRDGKQVHALFDRCPHRLSELSPGRVVDGAIECPYHGWRFGEGGKCVAMPGHLGDLPHVRIKSFATIEQDGVIFVASKPPNDPPYSHCLAGQDIVVRRAVSLTNSTLVDTAENILDATHTHFTHKGIFRGLNAKRYQVEVIVTGGPGWVEACYTGEDKQQGLVSKLLEGVRTKTIGRFKYPGIVELEYWGPNGMNLAATFHLRQSQPETVEGIGFLAGPRQGGLGHAKALILKPFFNIALKQDSRVLKSALANAKNEPTAKPVIGPLDFLRTDIEKILAGKLPEAAKTPQTYLLEL